MNISSEEQIPIWYMYFQCTESQCPNDIIMAIMQSKFILQLSCSNQVNNSCVGMETLSCFWTHRATDTVLLFGSCNLPTNETDLEKCIIQRSSTEDTKACNTSSSGADICLENISDDKRTDAYICMQFNPRPHMGGWMPPPPGRFCAMHPPFFNPRPAGGQNLPPPPGFSQ